MKEIKLTQGKVALVNDEDFEYLNQFKWYPKQSRNTCYAIRNVCFPNGKRSTIPMHREILGTTNPKVQGDHIDHDGLNNQRFNLRVCTNQENCRNRNSRMNSTSKFKGVCLFKPKQSNKTYWIAQIVSGGGRIHLGYYKTEEEAAIVYNIKAKELYGKFANLNNVGVL